jgi:amino acid adenylation domain-containing protein
LGLMTKPDAASAEGAVPFDDSARERRLRGWAGTAMEFPQVCTHELFERQVARTPRAAAVLYGERQVSYQELNERANKLAHYLRKRGVGADVLVGVGLERTPDMVAALLAVWKAGGAYVPLDPAYPPERLSFMIEDAQMPVLLTQDKFRDLFSSIGDQAIYLDSGWPVIEHEDGANLDPVSTPSSLAYLIYTSGSTGKPKGAMIVHRGLVNYLTWAIKAYRVEPGGSVPVHSSISFDLTVTSLYTPLLAGGAAELLPDDFGAQQLLAALLRQGDRSLVKITPAHLDLLSAQIAPEQLAGLTRAFVIGGENLLADRLETWRTFAPETRLINEYGPTETVVGCCIHEVHPGDPRTGSVPIGRPIANTQLHILDESLRPVPAGAIGDLYIGGAGVARGYLNRAELTAERFVADPFSGVSGARLYKSGDLARYREDGTLEFLGRADDQVKIHGYRIELGEIEAVLATHPNVRSCAVLAREDEPGTKRLAAYLVCQNGTAPASGDLRAFLGESLPEYMVPAHYIVLDTLPLTPNGKVDRKALPAPSASMAGAGRGGAPQTQTQIKIAEIWRDLLKADNIGIGDDFFDLGGHSLAATALIQRLRSTFGVEVRLASLFDRPTIASLSEAVDILALTEPGLNPGAGEREEFSL